MESQGRCETTLTERFRFPECACGTYPDNLGPCLTWEEGGNGRCAYCDHGPVCHADLAAQREKEDADSHAAGRP
jgi:hypothetical protein